MRSAPHFLSLIFLTGVSSANPLSSPVGQVELAETTFAEAPDYFRIPLRMNSPNNVHKWAGGKWTFVRHGSGGKNKPTLNPDGTRFITPALHWRD